jgi:steroid delta-isomerase-like uncharacterized protein
MQSLLFLPLVVLASPPPELKVQANGLEQNKRLVRRVYEECINGGKFELLDSLIADGFQGAPGSPGAQGLQGPAAFAAPLKALHQAFPDIHYEVLDLLAEGDRVAIRWRWTGTHQAQFTAYPATHRKMSNDGMAVFRVEGGKIAASWIQTDRLGFLQEMGAVSKDLGRPPPPAPK